VQTMKLSGISRLILSLAIVAGAWLIALPWIARQPAEHDSWTSLNQSGIDPSAMYYSELEVMKPILERINRTGRLEK